MLISEALASYTTQLQADGRSRCTIAQVERHVRMFVRWTGETTRIEDVQHETVARFLASEVVTRRADGGVRKPTSSNALRSSLRTFLAYCHGAGYTQSNAGRLVRRARCGPPVPRAITDEDRTKLLAALAGARTPAEHRDRVLFTVLLSAGLRVGSALAADAEDFDAAAGAIRLRTMKNADQDVAHLPRETAAIVREHLAGRTCGPLFPGVEGARLGARQVHRRLGIWAKRAGLSRSYGAHSLRHGFAVALLRKTGNLVVVSRALSHRSLASTMAYARVGSAEVRAAIGA